MHYKVIVATGNVGHAGTINRVFLTLVGEHGKSERTLLNKQSLHLRTGAVNEFVIKSHASLGRVLMVCLEKHKLFVEDDWFCSFVQVTPPGAEYSQTFPCYRWLVGDVKVEIRDGTAKKLQDECLGMEQAHRRTELQERQETFRWQTSAPGILKCIDANSLEDLPRDVRFADVKRCDFNLTLINVFAELTLKTMFTCKGQSWDDLDQLKGTLHDLSPIAEFTMEHWEEDWFFGYQFLNGSNPRMIRRCRELPAKFPVSGDMVQPFLSPNTTLDKELEAGKIYLVDYAILDGIPENVINGKKQYIAAPLCLLYEHPVSGVIPIAIQLEQNPRMDTPIFFPNDPKLAWLLAKMWVRHAEFQVFEVVSHLLRTHLIAEVFCVATLRHLPAVHPIYKLLIPHLRYTLEINVRARTQLISQDGIFKSVVSTGGDGLLVLSQRECKVMTYRSLQPYCDFEDRDVNELKNYFYRDHSRRLWDTIKKFVSDMVYLYYESDSEVVVDSELQAWIKDVVEEGFADVPQFGLPNKLEHREELITLLTVVIFTSSAQHAAINNGQFDFCAWVPNTACTMRQAPPTDKSRVTMDFIMNTLPDMSQSATQVAITWLLAKTPPDAEPLSHYSEKHFTELAAQKAIDCFMIELMCMEEDILKQEKGPEPAYRYLCPSRVENSITI